MIFFCKILLKNMNSTYEFALKEGPKMKMEIFVGTKSWRNFLERLKQKVDIFIETKNILTLYSIAVLCHIIIVYGIIVNSIYTNIF